jgi:hypothetical protein
VSRSAPAIPFWTAETALRARVDSLLDCSKILADAIEQMWDFAEREEIVSTLRRAADLLESEG